MLTSLKLKVLVLQFVAAAVFGILASFAFWGSNFTYSQIRNQLSEQQITFPTANSPALKALPTNAAMAMRQYAGEQMTTGDQANVWANDFIAVHLKEIGRGHTYAYWSGKALSEHGAQAAADDNIALTLFRGETLRSLLLNAWAFWFVASLAFSAGVALTVGALIVFMAFLYELFVSH